jgi:hypothetical protein
MKHANYPNTIQTLNAGGWSNIHINKFLMYASVHNDFTKLYLGGRSF